MKTEVTLQQFKNALIQFHLNIHYSIYAVAILLYPLRHGDYFVLHYPALFFYDSSNKVRNSRKKVLIIHGFYLLRHALYT